MSYQGLNEENRGKEDLEQGPEYVPTLPWNGENFCKFQHVFKILIAPLSFLIKRNLHFTSCSIDVNVAENGNIHSHEDI